MLDTNEKRLKLKLIACNVFNVKRVGAWPKLPTWLILFC